MLTEPPPVTAAVGVFANLPSVIESTSGAKSVGFTVSLTSPEANATTISYSVVDPGPGFLTAAAFGGTLPNGTVTIAAGQTSAVFTVAMPADVLGAAADETLEVVISSSTGETVFAPLAQTQILAPTPRAGNPATPLVEKIGGDGTLSGAAASYVLNLGTVSQYANPLLADLGVLNNGTIPADLLSGSFVVNGASVFVNSGFSPFTPIAAGAADTAPQVEMLTDQIGTFSETITLSPTDSNLTGYSGSLAPVTVVVEGNGGTAAASAAAPGAGGDRVGRRASDHVRRAVLRLPGGRRVRADQVDHRRRHVPGAGTATALRHRIGGQRADPDRRRDRQRRRDVRGGAEQCGLPRRQGLYVQQRRADDAGPAGRCR